MSAFFYPVSVKVRCATCRGTGDAGGLRTLYPEKCEDCNGWGTVVLPADQLDERQRWEVEIDIGREDVERTRDAYRGALGRQAELLARASESGLF